MQLIVYSAQSNDLAASLKWRQLHIQREIQHLQFSATFENQGSGTIYNTQYMVAIRKKLRMWNCFTMENPVRMKSNIPHTVSIKHNALKCSLLSIPHKEMI